MTLPRLEGNNLHTTSADFWGSKGPDLVNRGKYTQITQSELEIAPVSRSGTPKKDTICTAAKVWSAICNFFSCLFSACFGCSTSKELIDEESTSEGLMVPDHDIMEDGSVPESSWNHNNGLFYPPEDAE